MIIELYTNVTKEQHEQLEARFAEMSDQYQRDVFAKCVDCLSADDRVWFDQWWESKMPDGFWDEVGVQSPPAYHAIMQAVSLGLG